MKTLDKIILLIIIMMMTVNENSYQRNGSDTMALEQRTFIKTEQFQSPLSSEKHRT